VSEVDVGDELPHAAGAHASWRERYAFELFDAASGLVGSALVEARPNEGAIEAALTFLLEDGGLVTARHVAPCGRETSHLAVDDVRLAMIEPLRRWRIEYDGPCHSLAQARDAARPEAWRKSRLERLIVDLEFSARHAAVPLGDGFAQSMLCRGEVWVSGDRYALAVPGVRARTWGDEAVPRARRRFALAFADGQTLDVAQTVLEDGTAVSGWIASDTAIQPVRSLELSTTTEPGSYHQRAFELALVDAAGTRHEVSGDVLRLAPLPGLRGAQATMLCEGVVRARCAGRDGFGVAAYLHRLDADGRPLEPVV
jgi:hypothetical protein